MARAGRFLGASGVLLIVLATATTWRIFDLQRSAQIQTLVEREVGFASDLFVRDLNARYAAVAHFAHLWERGTPPQATQFYEDVQEQMDSTPGLRAIALADAQLILRHVGPVAFRDMEGRSIVASESRRRALMQARDSRRTVISDPVSLMDGSGSGFLMYVPLFEHDVFKGVLIVVFQAQNWIQSLSDQRRDQPFLASFALRILLNGQPLFESADFATSPERHAAAMFSQWSDAQIQVIARPRPSYYSDHWHWTPESLALVVLLTLSALSALIMLLRRARLAETSAQGAAMELMERNASLRDEAQVRRAAEADARRAREATARFLATMSHEVRTPLNAIIGMFQLIDAAPDLKEKQRKQAAMGIQAARRLHRDLSNVLDASRLDAGALSVRVENTELAPVTQAWSAAFEAYVMQSRKDITIQIEIADDLPETAWIDAAALTQVVNNLLDNAVKFTPEGQVSLQVFGRGDTLHIRVTDTGIGIDPKRRVAVFERFYQVDEGLERRFSGTGLGLAITHDLVRLMAGTVQVHENAPKGSRFEVKVPQALMHIIPGPAIFGCATDQTIRLRKTDHDTRTGC